MHFLEVWDEVAIDFLTDKAMYGTDLGPDGFLKYRGAPCVYLDLEIAQKY